MRKTIVFVYITLFISLSLTPVLAVEVNFEKDSQTVGENVGKVTVSAVLDKADENNTIVVPYMVSGSALGDNIDHDLKDGAFTFKPGQTSASVSFLVIDDTIPENDEVVILVMGKPVNATAGDIIVHTVRIIDNDVAALPNVSWTAAIQNLDESAGIAEVTVALSRISTEIVVVPYTVTGSATGGGIDHDLTDGKIIIPAGEAIGKLMFNITDDNLYESNETVMIMMGDPENAIAGPITIHTATIVDNDLKPTVSWAVESGVVKEDKGTLNVTLLLSAISSKTVIVPFSVSGTATGDGVDYSLSDGSVVIEPGLVTGTVEFNIIDDAIYEKDETVILTIHSPINANIGAFAVYTLVIEDNDRDTKAPIITLSGKNPVTVELGGDYSDNGATALDDMDGDITDKIVVTSNVNTKIEGVYRVTFDVHDAAGNAAVQVARLVQVTPAPEIYEVPMGIPAGAVVDHNGIPLPDVMVSSKDVFYMTKTDDSGAFFYTPLFLTGKTYYLTFSKIGYISTSRRYSGTELLDKVVLAAENAPNHDVITGICRSYKGVPLSGVGVRLESNQYPAVGFSDDDGWYRLAVDQRAKPYIVTAFKYGYQKKTFTAAVVGGYPNDMVLTPETVIIINDPETSDVHEAARAADQLEISITAEPPFSGNLQEISVEGAGVGAPVFSSGGAYIITYSPYNSLSVKIKADTTEDNNIHTGYAGSRHFTFTALPKNATMIRSRDTLVVAPGYPLMMKSKDKNSRTLVVIPADGLRGEFVPETVAIVATEYQNHGSGFIAGAIVEVAVGDESGRLFNPDIANDAPLKAIYVVLEYGFPVTKERLEEGSDIIRRADSAQALLDGGGSIISADQIVEINKDYVMFKSPKTGAFGIEPVDPYSLIKQGIGAAEDDSFCFIGGVMF